MTKNPDDPKPPKNELKTTASAHDVLAILRTETALSRFPMHQLTKGQVKIELRNQASAVHWKVTYDSGYGIPGPLAYKIESLFINRRIEENGRPVPKFIRLGSLREIAEQVDLGNNTNALKNALLQNATSNITAKISYRTKEGGEQWLEAVFNRYSVIFTGEILPNGGKADAVYLVLNDIYQQVLNSAVFRPLDYDYMKTLPPISQRFYEIASYQIFGALKLGNPRAKLLYSEYCLLSTATRYLDFDHVKKQMYKILRPHIRNGYLAKVEYQSFTNEAGEADWVMLLTPGPNADREYRNFTGQLKTAKKNSRQGNSLSLPFFEELPSEMLAESEEPNRPRAQNPPHVAPMENPVVLADHLQIAAPAPAELKPEEEMRMELIEALVASELNRSDAERFALEKPGVCRRQLEYLPFVENFKTSRGAYLRRAIEGDFGPPPAYARAQTQSATKAEEKRRRGEKAFLSAQEKAREGHKIRFYGAFCDFVNQTLEDLEKTLPEAAMDFREKEETMRAGLTHGPFAGRPLTLKSLETFDTPIARAERFLIFAREAVQQRRFPTLKHLEQLNFWEWDKNQNPDSFQG